MCNKPVVGYGDIGLIRLVFGMMFQKTYNMLRLTRHCVVIAVLFMGALPSCALFFGSRVAESGKTHDGKYTHTHRYESSHGHDSVDGARTAEQEFNGGIAVGFVVNEAGGKKLKSYQRRRYANQIAAHLLAANPQLQGRLDSYSYVAARLGPIFPEIIERYRVENQLSNDMLQVLQQAELRRRYLLLASISPIDQQLQLAPEVKPVRGQYHPEVDDYEKVRLQTARLKTVNVTIYDTRTGQQVMDKSFSTDSDGRVIATQRSGTRYQGNSLLAAVSNSVRNRLHRDSSDGYPPAPSVAETLNFLWGEIARSVPKNVTS